MINCARCGVPIGPDDTHHINGNHEDDSAYNRIGLCGKCHDFVQGVCDKCRGQEECHKNLFLECWRFEDAILPIHFRMKQEMLPSVAVESSIENPKRFERVAYFGRVKMIRGYCKKCGGYSLKVDGRFLCCAPDKEDLGPLEPPLILQARCKICRNWFWNDAHLHPPICQECRGGSKVWKETSQGQFLLF